MDFVVVVLDLDVVDDVVEAALDLGASLALVCVAGFDLAGAWHTTDNLAQSQLFAV